MDPTRRIPGGPPRPEVNNPAQENAEREAGTFRGDESSRDVVRESVLGSRRDRPLEFDSAAEPPTARRRINERGAEVSVRRGKLSRDEKFVLSAGNKKEQQLVKQEKA